MKKDLPQSLDSLDINRWEQILGNVALIEFCKDLVWAVRVKGVRTGLKDFNAIISGLSRTGKSMCIRFTMKCIGCFDLNFETLVPCGRCMSCKTKQYRSGNRGWENWCSILSPEDAPTPIEYHYAPVDCTTLDKDKLARLVFDLEANEDSLNIVYLDEIHRLTSRNMDEQLLIPMESYEAIWIASSAYADRSDGSNRKPLEKMLLNRFTHRLTTQKPSVDELVIWLAERCERLGVTVEDPRTTLGLIAQRSDRIPGLAQQVVDKVSKKRDKTLTRKILDQHVFDFDDGQIFNAGTDE